jgi:hypothetical protein
MAKFGMAATRSTPVLTPRMAAAVSRIFSLPMNMRSTSR